MVFVRTRGGCVRGGGGGSGCGREDLVVEMVGVFVVFYDHICLFSTARIVL